MAEAFQSFLKTVQVGAGLSWQGIQALLERQPRYLSILNGIVGDTLAKHKSRLAIPMSLRGDIRGDKVCVLVHGLCDSETTWSFPEDPARDYGSLLREHLGYAPLYLRYNSGLHISTNGRRLAQLLAEKCASEGASVREWTFIGHSMGGLVVRSACHYAKKARAPWIQRVKKIFLLGAPHRGTDLEKLGNLTSSILRVIPNPVTMGLAALGNLRSAGIKDLRFGYLLDEDWKGRHADELWRDNSHPVPLLEGVSHYQIAATLAKKSDHFLAHYFGDGLVPSRSAAGRSFRKSKTIPFSPEHFKVLKGLSHSELAHHDEVYEQLRAWIREP